MNVFIFVKLLIVNVLCGGMNFELHQKVNSDDE